MLTYSGILSRPTEPFLLNISIKISNLFFNTFIKIIVEYFVLVFLYLLAWSHCFQWCVRFLIQSYFSLVLSWWVTELLLRNERSVDLTSTNQTFSWRCFLMYIIWLDCAVVGLLLQQWCHCGHMSYFGCNGSSYCISAWYCFWYWRNEVKSESEWDNKNWRTSQLSESVARVT